jgi:DNA mismatch repair protein MutS2
MSIVHTTLELLDYSKLCRHLSTFAATKLGVMAATSLTIPQTQGESEYLLKQTEEIYLLESRLPTGLNFEGINDIFDSLERAKIGGILEGKELLNIATTLSGMRKLRRQIEEYEDIPTLLEIVSQMRTYPELEQEIHYCIDDHGEVCDRASALLSQLRISIKGLRENIYRILQGIIQRQGAVLQEGVITQRGDRFVIPVKAPQKDQIPGIVHDTSSTGATLYIEPKAVVSYGNQLRQIISQAKREEERILKELTQKIGAIYEDLEQLLAIATQLDLATAKARYSLWLEGNPPRFINIEEKEQITLRKLVHPLLLWQYRYEEGTEVVPIDITVNPQIKVVAITGPNTGGKTVTLKTLGLASLMAKVGLFIPAKVPVEIPWFDRVLADIGDEQSIEQSLSTFSGHIRRISSIIEALNHTQGLSLILLDEVGAGTDPAEGSALAIALLKYLADHAHLTVATTHYGELKALKYQDSRFENASVEFDDQSLQPTYRLLWGIPGRSNALIIAQRLGLNLEIIEDAKIRVGGYSEDINEVIAGLESQRKEQEAKAQAASKLLQQTEKFYAEVSAKAYSLQERETALKISQEKTVQEEINKAKLEIAQVIKDLQRGVKTAQNARKATNKLNQIAQESLPIIEPKKAKPAYYPKVGEKIKIPRLGQTAEVLEINTETGDLTVRFGLMKMNIPVTDIESLDGKKVEEKSKQKSQSPAKNLAQNTVTTKEKVTVRTSQNTLDLRGARVSDGELKIDNAISNAILKGLNVLWIIHGKGTGKLKEGVHNFLKLHSQIESFEIAPQNEGGAGVTIAYLK